MTYFLFQSTLIISVAFIAGAIIGWWLHHFTKEPTASSDNDLGLIKNYLAESIKENARLKLQIRNTEEKIEKLNQKAQHDSFSGRDIDALQAFEETLKKAQMRKYLN